MVKKDQLWAIAFTKRRYDKLFRFYLKWLLWQPATALEILFDSSDANLLFYKIRFDFQTSISWFMFSSIE